MSFAANIPIGDFRGENRGVESTVSLLVAVKYCTLVDLNCFKTQFISKQFHTATVGLMISISFIGPTYLFWSNLLQTPTKIRVWQFVMYSPPTKHELWIKPMSGHIHKSDTSTQLYLSWMTTVRIIVDYFYSDKWFTIKVKCLGEALMRWKPPSWYCNQINYTN